MINRPLYIRKFHSGRLKEFGYNIENTFEESKELNEIIGLSDNQMMKTMRSIQNRTIDKVKVEILIQMRDHYRLQLTYQQTKKGHVTATTIANKLKKIKTKNALTKRLYEKYVYITVNAKEAQRIQDKINRTLFQPDYVMVMILETSGVKADSFADAYSFEELGVAILSTMPLNLNIIATPVQGAELESQYDFTALNESLAATKAAEADMIAKNAEWEKAEGLRNIAENGEFDENGELITEGRVQAEQARVDAEKQREENVSSLIQNCQKSLNDKIDEFESKTNAAIEDCQTKTRAAIQECDDKADRASKLATNAAGDANTAAASANNAATYANSEAQKCNEVYQTVSSDAEAVIEECETARDRANIAAQNCEDIVAGVGMVMQSEKGVAGGVASLDADGKVPTKQLPELGEKYGVGGEELGLVKNGGNVIIDSDGGMHAPELIYTGDGNVMIQADWSTEDMTLASYIRNRPPIRYGTGDYSVIEGSIKGDIKNVASGKYSHAEGVGTKSNGYASHAEGDSTNADGSGSHAEGAGTNANGSSSHAEGASTNANGYASHAEGDFTNADGSGSHAEGVLTNANGSVSHAEGASTNANGYASHAEGDSTNADGYASHAEGLHTQITSNSPVLHVQGKYNIVNDNNVYAHIVGNGNSANPSNAHTLDWKGNASFAGSIKSNGEDYAEFFEWLDGNSDNEDRVGLLVALDGEKIRLANADDEILGIISGTVAVLGGNYEWEWNGKYLTDEFGRVIYDMVEEFSEEIVGEDEEGNPIIEKQSLGFFKHPRINSAYNPEKAYVNRSDRPEWSAVGMFGKLYVRDDGTCRVNGYVTVGENGIATVSSKKTNMRVLSRVNGSVIRVLLR